MSDGMISTDPLASWASVLARLEPDPDARSTQSIDLGRTVSWSNWRDPDVEAHGIPVLDAALTNPPSSMLDAVGGGTVVAYLIPAGWLHLDEVHAAQADVPAALPRGWYRVPDLRFDLVYSPGMWANPSHAPSTRLTLPCPAARRGFGTGRLLRVNNVYTYDQSICTGHMSYRTWFSASAEFAGVGRLASPLVVRDFVYAWLLARPNDDLNYPYHAVVDETRDRMGMAALANWLRANTNRYELSISRYGLYFHQWVFMRVYHPDIAMDAPSDALRAALDDYWAVTLGRAVWSESARRAVWPGQTLAGAGDVADGTSASSPVVSLLCNVVRTAIDEHDIDQRFVDTIDLTLASVSGGGRIHATVATGPTPAATVSVGTLIDDEAVGARLDRAMASAGLTVDNAGGFLFDPDRYEVECGSILDAHLLMIHPR